MIIATLLEVDANHGSTAQVGNVLALRTPIMIESIDAINREVSKHSINGNK